MVAGCAGTAGPTVSPTELAAATATPTLEPTIAPMPTPSGTPAAATPVPICASPCPVRLVDGGYIPNTLKVKVGTEVIWTNASCHGGCTVTFDPGYGVDSVDSGPLGIGRTFKHTFNIAGVYRFHCKLDPLQMVGTITVT
jgi:plastocyanin